MRHYPMEKSREQELILLIAASLLPTYADAAKLNLKQDLGGFDLTITMEPTPDSPTAIRIVNKSHTRVECKLSYTGANAGTASTVTINPGNADTMRVIVDDSNAPRSGNLKCAAWTPASKKK